MTFWRLGAESRDCVCVFFTARVSASPLVTMTTMSGAIIGVWERFG